MEDLDHNFRKISQFHSDYVLLQTEDEIRACLDHIGIAQNEQTLGVTYFALIQDGEYQEVWQNPQFLPALTDTSERIF